MVDYNKFKRLKANRDKVKDKQKKNKTILNNYEQLQYKQKISEIINARKFDSKLQL